MDAALSGLLAALLLTTFVWLLSLPREDVSIIDVVWGPGFVLVALVYYLSASGDEAMPSPRALLVVLLVTLWGVRLAVHIFRRNRGKPEDRRYRQMRERHGQAFWWRSLFIVFWLQAVILWVVSWPLLRAIQARTPAELTLLDAAGVFLFALGFLFESVGDRQLARFRADPRNRGRVFDRGLWRYTRHPNYFGDAVLWWGLFVIALATPGSAWTIISPALMTFLLMRVSGVTLLERDLSATKPGYREYIERTSAFFPWPPKRSAARRE